MLSGLGRSADLKCAGEKMAANRGIVQNGQIGEQKRGGKKLNQRRWHQLAAVGRRLENTMRITDWWIIAGRVTLMIGGMALFGLLSLLKKMMDAMGRGIKEKEKKNTRVKEVGGACEFGRHKVMVTGHRVGKQPNLTPSAKWHSRAGLPMRTSLSN